MQQLMDKLRIMAKESLIEMKAQEDPDYVKRKADRTLRIKMIQMEGREDFEKTKQKYKEIIENSDQSEIDKEVHKMVVKYSNRQNMNL